jgi:hypothetical protein
MSQGAMMRKYRAVFTYRTPSVVFEEHILSHLVLSFVGDSGLVDEIRRFVSRSVLNPFTLEFALRSQIFLDINFPRPIRLLSVRFVSPYIAGSHTITVLDRRRAATSAPVSQAVLA